MTTTVFQWVVDNAESISINRRAVTSQTMSRDLTIRTVSRGAVIWRFDVKMPDGLSWTTIRSYIEAIDYADRFTPGTFKLNDPGYSSWLSAYRGNSANYTGFYATWVNGNNYITLTTSPTTTSGYKFRAGDFIQLGTAGRVYSVVSDVAYNSNTVYINRPVLDATQTTPTNLQIADNATWNVIATELPSWNIFQRDQVSWSGNFVFYEVM